MNRFTPVMRISLGLVLVTCSLVISLDLIGVVPAPADAELESRLQLAETLALHATTAVQRNDIASVRTMLLATVRRNDSVLSAGVRLANGRLLASAGAHGELWQPEDSVASTPSHVRIPLLKDTKRWATIEMRFEEIGTGGALRSLWQRPLTRMMLLLAVTGFFAYTLYMKRTLRHLDPSAVIPTRVQAALDVMAEGVIILDQKERIVLSNAAFAEGLGRSSESLMGSEPSRLGWQHPDSGEKLKSFPWRDAIRHGENVAGTRIALATDDGTLSFIVKAAPVLEADGSAKGAIATFDDVTTLERQRADLADALVRLEKSEEERRLQSEEMEALARSDPLTGVANRRFFMQTYDPYFAVARREGRSLCCMMVDLDEFKKVNDTHGHAAGDDALRRVAEALADEARSRVTVCRYGGEEFCLLLEDSGIDEAVLRAERLRARIQSPGFARAPITASFGVSSIAGGARSLLELINQADEALYAAKCGGRNQVSRWDQVARGT